VAVETEMGNLDMDGFATLPTSASAVVTPEKKRKTTKLPVFLPTAKPEGTRANGFSGPSSILKPKGYGALTQTDIAFLNQLSKDSGGREYKRAKDPYAENQVAAAPVTHTSASTSPFGAMWKNSLSSLGVDVAEAVEGTTPFVSETVSQCLFHPMEAIGMHSVSTMADFINKNLEDGMEVRKNPKCNIIFVPVMINKGFVSNVNALNQPEFLLGPHNRPIYNDTYWSSHMETKKTRSGGEVKNFNTLDVGFFIPDWAIPDAQKEDHHQAMKFLKNCGPMVKQSDNVGHLNLKDHYAFHFIKQMQSSLVARARLAGFSPIWLMKNCLLYKSAYGSNGYQFTSLNKNPKSFIHMCGFCKGSEKDGNLPIVVLANQNNEFLALT